MLVTFDSDVGGFTMFGDAALKLLKMMGHSGTVPSAILAEDIPAALSRLEAGLQAEAPASARPQQDDKRDPPVSLGQRAYPLIDLLTRAAARGCAVTWK
jgi:hypothetical protein